MDSRELNHKWYDNFDPRTMTLEVEGRIIRAQYEVCDVCQGRGRHVNPSIDSNGLSSDDFAQDPDFEEDYFSGKYDIECRGCKGMRVQPVIADDESAENQKWVDDSIRSHYELEREMAFERRMGC